MYFNVSVPDANGVCGPPPAGATPALFYMFPQNPWMKRGYWNPVDLGRPAIPAIQNSIFL